MQRIILLAKVIITLVMLCFVTGCMQTIVASDVQDNGALVKTHYKYCFVGSYIKNNSGSFLLNGVYPWLRSKDDNAYPDWLSRKDDKDYLEYQKKLERLQPDVFACNGIPITIEYSENYIDNAGIAFITGMLLVMSCGIFPFINIDEFHINTSIYILDDSIPISDYHVVVYAKQAIAYSPLPMLFFSSDPKISGYEDKRTFWSDKWMADVDPLLDECSAYALATKLKELEDADIINDNVALLATQAWATRNSNIASKKLHSRQSQRQQQATSSIPSQSTVPSRQNPPQASMSTERQQPVHVQQQTPQQAERQQPAKKLYRIVESERENGEVFARRFVLEALGDLDVSTERMIRREYVEDLKLDFAETFGVRDVNSIYVDFSQFILRDRRIEGRAIVFSATPSAYMEYNANSRRGKMTVRFNNAVRGADWAREWACRNIEMLVRDKNILLTTGERPPAGQYTSLNEKWNGNILEIEFKTE